MRLLGRATPVIDFEPRVAIASLSGESNAEWAAAAEPYVGLAVLGGIAIDEPARRAARTLLERDRREFLPADPIEFVDRQLRAADRLDLRVGMNVRSTTRGPIEAAATVCANRGALLEINAHCRQPELRAVGCGESLLVDTERLAEYVSTAVSTGATVGVKVRAEVDGVDLVETGRAIEAAGASFVHVDAMDSESIVGAIVAATELFVIANNGVRDRDTARAYLAHGADAVSVGRPSRRPETLAPIRTAVDEWFAEALA
ncbi:MAG: tRNA-dihydrouridine synthase [Halobacteriota archaeon]